MLLYVFWGFIVIIILLNRNFIYLEYFIFLVCVRFVNFNNFEYYIYVIVMFLLVFIWDLCNKF